MSTIKPTSLSIFFIEDGAVATMDIRLAYSNNPDSYKIPESWSLVVNSTQERPLDCIFAHPKNEEHNGFNYNCDPLFLLQLGSIPHKYYLLNIRLPVNTAKPQLSPNMKIGQVTEIEFVVSCLCILKVSCLMDVKRIICSLSN